MASGNVYTDSMSNYSTVADALLKWNGFTLNGGLSAVGASFALGNSPQGIQQIGKAMSRAFAVNYQHLFYGIRHKFVSGYGSNAPQMGGFCDGANAYQISWGRNSTGTLFLARGGALGVSGGTVLATSVLTVTAGSTHYIELEVSVDPTTGLVNLWVDNTLYVTFSGNTRATANNFANNVQVYAGNGGAELWSTDCYVNQSGGSFLNGRLGPVDISSTKLTGAGAHTDFSRGGTDTGTNVGQINKALVSTTSFNTDFVAGHRDDYTPDPLLTGTILGARAWLYGQKDGGGARSAAITHTRTTDIVGGNLSLSGPGFGWYTDDVSDDPSTGAVYASLAAFNATKFGYKLTI